jgi:hypothetical protein
VRIMFAKLDTSDTKLPSNSSKCASKTNE